MVDPSDDVNRPAALAELTAVFERYERALLANDLGELNRLFWASPLTQRYGSRDAQYSHAEIAQFREARGAIDQRRALINTRITTFADDFGVTSTEFSPVVDRRTGRQTQVWVRMAEGWRIVSAHVSLV